MVVKYVVTKGARIILIIGINVLKVMKLDKLGVFMNKLCEWDRLLEREKSLRDYEKEMYARITNNQKGLKTEESRIYFLGYACKCFHVTKS